MSGQGGCEGCRDGEDFDIPITMAFQPIVDVRDNTTFAYEALVRGVDGSGAGAILASLDDRTLYAFDQKCRVTAIELAQAIGLPDGASLSINFLPNAVYEPRACIRLTLSAAMRTGLPVERIIFEFTESERIDTDHLLSILRTYRALGFRTAIDDFGTGFASLELVTRFRPDIVKLDMGLVRGIDSSREKRTVLRHTLAMFRDLDVTVTCEGVETVAELDVLCDLGVHLVQGYLLGKPRITELAPPAGVPRSSAA